MLTYKVESIPLKDVIISLAASFGVSYTQNCEEFYVEIPENLGCGEIRGINFENGLGVILYNCTFLEDVRLEFTLDQIHPVKYIYSLKGPLSHSFINQNIPNAIDQYNCAIVASEKNSGHVIEFSKNVAYEVLSLEIDRIEFLKTSHCELKLWNSPLQVLLEDVNAEKQFYHEGSCGIYFKNVLQEINKVDEQVLARKMNLHCVAMQIFINQLVQFDDDLLNNEDRTVLRIQELKRVEEAAHFIKKNLKADLSIKNISKKSGLNPNKLQIGFKHLYNSTINEYVTNARLEKSNILLKNKEYNVAEVVALVGIESSSYFSKIYKKKYGITPKNYKKMFS